MELMQAVWLALLQGLTEFLPISSSAHLILLPHVVGWADQGLAFDVAVHVGTLIAVLGYFRRDVAKLIVAWLTSVSLRRVTAESRLAWYVLVGTIPVGIAGLLLNDAAETILRSPLVIAASTIGFGLFLWFADIQGARMRNLEQMQWRDCLVIGLFQILALIPGTSRSGITMTGGLLLGLTRDASARFSFLLSIPVIALAGGLKTLELIQSGPAIDWLPIGVGVLVSAVSAWLCIALFLRLLERIGMLPFVIYRLALGILLCTIYL